MRVAVVGAGVVGVATAYELVAEGHEVTVFERRGTAAERDSFATGGLVSPAWAAAWSVPERALHGPWSAPGPGLRRTGWTGNAPKGWSGRWQKSPAWRSASPAQVARLALLRLSQQRLDDLSAELQLDHDRSDGMLVLLRSAREVEQAAPDVASLRAQGLTVRDLSPAQARALEPALNPETPLAAALQLDGTAVGNCREWASLMRQHAQRLGCRFELQTGVRRIEPVDGRGVRLVVGDEAGQAFDAVVVCTGRDETGVLSALGLHLPLAMAWGHSVSAALREPLDAPQSAVFDLRHHVSITRLGQRVRVAGGADLSPTDRGDARDVLKRLYQVLTDWFPGAARLGGAQGSVQQWRGAQVMTPDDLPVVGQSRIPGVWLNTGHGNAGWAMASGCARLLAAQMGDRPSPLDAAPFHPSRLGA